MSRAFLLVTDSLGIGGAPDAARFGDTGSDTLGHIIASAHPHLPNLERLGLLAAWRASTGQPVGDATGAWGYAIEHSRGKDTPSGHWEMTGVPVLTEWGYFPPDFPSFPRELTDALIERGRLPGLLGNCHASGTTIIDELGAEHVATGKPIVYTSADSVFQIAAHEESFGLQRLYDLCDIARELVDSYVIGRVIARPFVGAPGSFRRTGNRRDLATPPPEPTLLDHLARAGRGVISIGKVGDIFAHQGTGRIVKADGNAALFDATLEAARTAPDGALVFTNFVDFDTLYGHRRGIAGYAAALEAFDARLPELEALLRPGDLAILSADHGCDPTWPGSDHTRENVPVIAFGPAAPRTPPGRRDGFMDIGQSLATHLAIPPLPLGQSFIDAAT